VEAPWDYPRSGKEARLAAVLVDQLAELPVVPLVLPDAKDARVCRVVASLSNRPDDARSMAQWAKAVGVSERTLARLFERDVHMPFQVYRTQLRLLRGLEWLGEGRGPAEVAYELGYESPAAFGAAFKRVLGTTPGRYFR
jgi:AraC-like DNA-binding protein